MPARDADTPTGLLALLPHPAFVVEVDDDDTFRFVFANGPYLALLGSDDLDGGDLRAVLPAPALVAHVRAFARAAHEMQPVAFEADWDSSAARRAVAVDVAPIVDADGLCRRLLGAAHEVTEQRNLREQLEHRTRHDPLTELPNRVQLVEWLHDAIARCAPEKRVGLALLDLDDFKVVNDSMGFAAGDELLSIVARRVEHVLRAGDRLARLGGDEFAVVCNGARRVDDLVTMAQRVHAVFAEPFVLSTGDEVFLGASIGIAASHGADPTPAGIMRDAEIAMFSAKDLGRGRVELFEDAMRERTARRLELERALRRALVRRQFRVHYQPLVHFERSEVTGFEALVRWDHPEHGLMEPDDFLPVAEETGLIVPIGAWVLHEACAQGARWAVESRNGEPLTVAVNISARQLLDPELPSIVDRAIAASGLDPSLLVLEISERALTEHHEPAVTALHAIGRRGVRVAIDDFGTGHSSVPYIKTLPVSTLKIDHTIVDRLGKDADDAAIVSALVDLGHALGLTVTAEGIETTAQLRELRRLGCDLGQGYYFARPQPSEIVRALVHHRFRWSGRESRSA